MTSDAFSTALTATGYLLRRGEPASGLHLSHQDAPARVRQVLSDPRNGLAADAVFTARGSPLSVFKDSGDREPAELELRAWHEAAWNIGIAPLLWVVTPTEVRVYDCYAPKRRTAPRSGTHLDRAGLDDATGLERLNGQAGRFATETGAFWSSRLGRNIDRRNRVDRQLLDEIRTLESELTRRTLTAWLGRVPAGPDDAPVELRATAREFAQKLIARTIFAWYIVDRRIADAFLPPVLGPGLPAALSNTDSALKLFVWLQETFNGDLFPKDDLEFDRRHLTAEHADLLRSFTRSEEVASGQGRLFKFRFDSLPIDLVSSVYQQFARSVAGDEAKQQSLHYTPVELADLVIDPVFEGLSPDARVLDPTCGSGVFLVEAFRRLVWKRCGDTSPSRAVVRDTLYASLYGVDVNPAALRVAAFSLCLAALELDSQPITDPADLKFDHLIGRTLHRLDLLETPLPQLEKVLGRFDAVVGNPPWTYGGGEPKDDEDAGPDESSERNGATLPPEQVSPIDTAAHGENRPALPRRSPDHAFVQRATALLRPNGRLGLILKATPFFTRDAQAHEARLNLFETLAPVALVSLAQLRLEKLFPGARAAALVLFGRCSLARSHDRLLVGAAPWTSLYRRSGIIEIGPSDFQELPLKAYRARPGLLKAAAAGSRRDVILVERLEEEHPTFAGVLDALSAKRPGRRGQGLIVGWQPEPFEADKTVGARGTVPDWLRGLRLLEPDDYAPFRVEDTRLKPYPYRRIERARKASIYEGPLLLCPKGRFLAGPRGRYSAATADGPLAYTQNFYGASFADGAQPLFRDVLCGILNSALTAYQLAFGGAAVGVERPAVSPQDLLALRVPFLPKAEPDLLRAVAEREADAARERTPEALRRLDDAVFALYDLEEGERTIVQEGLERNRWMFVDTREEFERVARKPAQADLVAYAGAVVRSVDAYLLAAGERHFEAVVHSDAVGQDGRGGGLAGVSFAMRPGCVGKAPAVRVSKGEDGPAWRRLISDLTTGASLPYLNERRAFRLYHGGGLMILRPAEWRYWTETAGLNDADAIMADHWASERG